MSLSSEENLATIIKELDDLKTSKIIIHKDKLLGFLFEYACQTLEYDGKSPVRYSRHIEGIMYNKLEKMIEEHSEEHYQEKSRSPLAVPAIRHIPKIIQQEKKELAGNYK
jgi:hypothetical protein